MTRPPSWSVGELESLAAAVVAAAFLRGLSPSDRRDWPEILAAFNDIRAFVDPPASGISRLSVHLKWQWKDIGSKGRRAEQEQTVAAFKESFASLPSNPQEAAVVALAKRLAADKADAARREAAAIAKHKADLRREKHRLLVRRLRAASKAARAAAIAANVNSIVPDAVAKPIMRTNSLPPLPPAPAGRAAARLRPRPPPVPARFRPRRLSSVEEVRFRPFVFGKAESFFLLQDRQWTCSTQREQDTSLFLFFFSPSAADKKEAKER